MSHTNIPFGELLKGEGGMTRKTLNVIASGPGRSRLTLLWQYDPQPGEYSHVIAEPVEGGYLRTDGKFFKSGDKAIFKKVEG